MAICTYNARTLASEAAIEDLMMQAKKIKGRNPRTVINWDLFATLAGLWEDSAMDNIDEEYDRLVEHVRDCAKKAESSKTTKRRLSLETLELITPAWSSTSRRKPRTYVRARKALQRGDKRRP
ncbi:hypothetical protein NECAME_08615 [Necator americanus]|uniref:Uncharacterized protein n=1 Tax=Necator americanus TaxID=51031 RepID=W2TJZ8_NECAM|nr:hypothetical protein NECAME_08615 [Necator americanus]ETN81307.1 hypothetical protein NECAME_08615 [Necator americanus]